MTDINLDCNSIGNKTGLDSAIKQVELKSMPGVSRIRLLWSSFFQRRPQADSEAYSHFAIVNKIAYPEMILYTIIVNRRRFNRSKM